MIFVDTSAWYASEVEDDVNHEKARKFLLEIASAKHGVAVTTDYVLDETLTLLQSKKGLSVALTFIGKVRKSQSIRTFWVNESIFEKATRYLQENRRIPLEFYRLHQFRPNERPINQQSIHL